MEAVKGRKKYEMRGRRGRSNSDPSCLGQASTLYGGGFSPSYNGKVGSTTPMSEHGGDHRQVNWKEDAHEFQPHRLNISSSLSPGSLISTENAEVDEDSHKKNSTCQKQVRKKHRGWHLAASKVGLKEKLIGGLALRSKEPGHDGPKNKSNNKAFEHLAQRCELEEEVLILHRQLEEELELRVVLENAVEHVSGPLTTTYPRNLPISSSAAIIGSAQLQPLKKNFTFLTSELVQILQLLADLTALEVAVLKLEEKSSTLRNLSFNHSPSHPVSPCFLSSLQSSAAIIGSVQLQPLKKNFTFLTSELVQILQLLADLTALEVAVHKLEEKSSTLRSQLQQAHAETEIVESQKQGVYPSLRQEPESQESQNKCKEQRARLLRQDLQLTIPEVSDNDGASPEYTSYQMGEKGSLHSALRCPYPLMDDEECCHEQYTQGFTLAQQDAKSLLPVAEVLWKPEDASRMISEATTLETWDLALEDDNAHMEDQPWAQLAEECSLDEIKSAAPLWAPLEDARGESENGWGSQDSMDCSESTDPFVSPNELSEQMVQCMVDIYHHLADPGSTPTMKGSSPKNSVPSPTSPLENLTNVSASSISESSTLVARSPLVDLRTKEEVLGNDATPDPFKVKGKVPWADIGAYSHVFEVPWLSVGKGQLEYAAQALRDFKLLVEQLATVDPSELKHDEKLAFWINLYNTLLMHAYLAYGIPRSDIKFFAMLQKAAYTVGGHSFNAATMEISLLKSKSTSHRSELAHRMAHSKNKLNEIQSKFGIDHPEPLASFALCSGTRSSPMVRIYKPESLQPQLRDALQDYARASVGISTKGKLLVPKLLYAYAREYVEDATLLDWVCNLLPSHQVAVIFDCIQQRRRRFLGSKTFNIVPFNFSFRYLFPGAGVGTQKVVS